MKAVTSSRLTLFSALVLLCLILPRSIHIPLLYAGVRVVPQEESLQFLTVRFAGRFSSEAFGDIIAALGNGGRVKVKYYIDRDGQTIKEIVRQTMGHLDPTISTEFSQYLCAMNSHACTIIKDGNAHIALWRNTKAPEEVAPHSAGDSDVSLDEICNTLMQIQQLRRFFERYNWNIVIKERSFAADRKNLAPYELCIPAVVVTSYPTIVFRDSIKGESLKNIVEDDAQGCLKLDDDCKLIILSLNGIREDQKKNNPFSSEYAFFGSLILPARGYSITWEVNSEEEFLKMKSIIENALSNLADRKNIPRELIPIRVIAGTSGRAKSQQAPTTDITRDSTAQKYFDALKAMNYTPLQAADLARLAPITVGVWDFRLDEEHCAFRATLPDRSIDKAIAFAQYDNTIPASALNAKPSPNEAGKDRWNCGTVRPALDSNIDYEHATHVAGIIAARSNSLGVLGMNPKAHIWAFELRGGHYKDLREKDPIGAYSTSPAKHPTLAVINISLSEKGTSNIDAIKQTVLTWGPRILFVAAAGNDGVSISRGAGCPVYPACLSELTDYNKSVISVVALNTQGNDLLKDASGTNIKTNYGTAFDVAAVGETVSTLYADSFGTMSGTSQAAPYVSALASLLNAKIIGGAFPIPPSALIKERILFTSDFDEKLDKWVLYGRINFDRSLDFASDKIELKGGTVCSPRCHISGKIESAGQITVTSKYIHGKKLDTEMSTTLAMKNIRRIYTKSDKVDTEGPYWIIYADAGDQKIISRAKIDASRANVTILLGDDENKKTIHFSDIKDYTVCSFARGC